MTLPIKAVSISLSKKLFSEPHFRFGIFDLAICTTDTPCYRVQRYFGLSLKQSASFTTYLHQSLQVVFSTRETRLSVEKLKSWWTSCEWNRKSDFIFPSVTACEENSISFPSNIANRWCSRLFLARLFLLTKNHLITHISFPCFIFCASENTEKSKRDQHFLLICQVQTINAS